MAGVNAHWTTSVEQVTSDPSAKLLAKSLQMPSGVKMNADTITSASTFLFIPRFGGEGKKKGKSALFAALPS